MMTTKKSSSHLDGITQNSKVVLVSPAPGGQLDVGDTGRVQAAWMRALVLVNWDKDHQLRSVHRKRLQIVAEGHQEQEETK